MTPVPAPTGWDTARPVADETVWRLPSPAGWVQVDPHAGLRTGPSHYGPTPDSPEAWKQLGWALLSACHRAAHVLEHGAPDVEPVDDPQLTIHDFEELARHG